MPEPPACAPGSGGGGRIGPGGSGGRATTGARGHSGDGVRKGRPHRRIAALRHPGFQDGEALDRPAAGADGGRGRRVPSPMRTSGVNLPVEDLRKDFDAILLAGGAEQPRDLNVPGPRTERHPFRDGLSAAAEQARRREMRSRIRFSPPASAWSSSAAAIRAPIAWALRIGRRPLRCISSRLCRCRRTIAIAVDAVAAVAAAIAHGKLA